MIRGRVADSARSVAKAWAHPSVEGRHVLFAVVKEFGDDPRLDGLAEVARQALEPKGSAFETPTMTTEAEALLEEMTSEDAAIAVVTRALASERGPDGQEGAAQVEEDRSAVATAPPASPREAAPPAETTEDVLTELDSLIGLESVKARVRSIIAVVQANAERERAGLPAVNPSLHLVFTGPPGTGKTTVARLVARLYAAVGAIPGARFREAMRADLIAGYVGQTAIKTAEVIRGARPGVLFIDEAYALTPRVDADFGSEAIATLVKAMEDHRDELAVIVAGYGDEMAQFIGSNPGLRSRFKTYVAFDDYSPEELTEIFQSFVTEAGLETADGVTERVLRVLADAASLQDFGNARFVRSLFEQAYVRMAGRAAEDGEVVVEELTTLVPEDIEVDLEALHRETKRIGFGSG